MKFSTVLSPVWVGVSTTIVRLQNSPNATRIPGLELL